MRNSKKACDGVRHAYEDGASIRSLVAAPPASHTDPFTACCASRAPHCSVVAVPTTALGQVSHVGGSAASVALLRDLVPLIAVPFPTQVGGVPQLAVSPPAESTCGATSSLLI